MSGLNPVYRQNATGDCLFCIDPGEGIMEVIYRFAESDCELSWQELSIEAAFKLIDGLYNLAPEVYEHYRLKSMANVNSDQEPPPTGA